MNRKLIGIFVMTLLISLIFSVSSEKIENENYIDEHKIEKITMVDSIRVGRVTITSDGDQNHLVVEADAYTPSTYNVGEYGKTITFYIGVYMYVDGFWDSGAASLTVTGALSANKKTTHSFQGNLGTSRHCSPGDVIVVAVTAIFYDLNFDPQETHMIDTASMACNLAKDLDKSNIVIQHKQIHESFTSLWLQISSNQNAISRLLLKKAFDKFDCGNVLETCIIRFVE